MDERAEFPDNPKPPFEFDSDDPQFARGFEAGQVWGVLGEYPDRPMVCLIRPENAEMMMRIAEVYKRPFRSEERADGLVIVYLDPAVPKSES